MWRRTVPQGRAASGVSGRDHRNSRRRRVGRAVAAACEVLESRFMMTGTAIEVYHQDFQSGSTSDKLGTFSGSVETAPAEITPGVHEKFVKGGSLQLSGLSGDDGYLQVSLTLYVVGDIDPSFDFTSYWFYTGGGGPALDVKGPSLTGGSDVTLVHADFQYNDGLGGHTWRAHPAYGMPDDPHIASAYHGGLGYDYEGNVWDPDDDLYDGDTPYCDTRVSPSGAYSVSFAVAEAGRDSVSISFTQSGGASTSWFGFDDVTVTEYTAAECEECGKKAARATEAAPGVDGQTFGGHAVLNNDATVGPHKMVMGIPQATWVGPLAGPREDWAHNIWGGESTIAVYDKDGLKPIWFAVSEDGETFTPLNGYEGSLAVDPDDADQLILTDKETNRTYYQSLTGDEPGRFVTYVDKNGDSWSPNVTGDIEWIARDGGGEKVEYAYDMYGRASSITLDNDGGDPAYSVGYSYLAGLNDVEFATLNTFSGETPVATDTYYYRYWSVYDDGYGDAAGYGEADVNVWDDGRSRAPKYVFGPDAYERLVADEGSNLSIVDDEDAAPYADMYYAAFSKTRVPTNVIRAGSGESEVTTTYRPTNVATVDGYNTWSSKSDTTRPDGTHEIAFRNFLGQTMLEVRKDLLGNERPVAFNLYGTSTADAGKLLMTVHPSAFVLHSSAYYTTARADLLDFSTGNSPYINDDNGLIELTQYYASTTAAGTNAGGVAGYFKQSLVRHGESTNHASIRQSKVLYYSHTSGTNDGAVALTTYPVAQEISYTEGEADGGEFGTAPRTTIYQYGFEGDATGGTGDDTNRIVWRKTIMPAVTIANNGPASSATDTGSADQVTEYYDDLGRVTWRKDGDGHIDYTAYDPDTGGIAKQIVDVDTTQISTFSGLPAGWSNASGLHLTTLYVTDAQGRVTQATDPNGNDTYTVYKDGDHEVRTYPGWHDTGSGDFGPTGPVQVTREDRGQGFSETFTYTYTPVSGDPPDGSDTIGTIQSLSRTFVDQQGQTDHVDRYATSVTYDTDAELGDENVDFYRTSFGYDENGRQNRVINSVLTITRTVYDDFGRVVSTWVGTDDSTTTGTWSPSNTSGANLTKISENLYDTYDPAIVVVGDSNLTRSTLFPNGTTAPRVTDMYYDWRDRAVMAKSGVFLNGSNQEDPTSETSTNLATVNRLISYTKYDNLGEVVWQEQYAGDGATMLSSNAPVDTDGTGPDGIPDVPGTNRLRARMKTDYDEQGRAWQTQMFYVDPSSGATNGASLKSWTWYDHRGNVLKSQSPGGLAAKYVYDGAGRVITQYTTDAAGDALPGISGSWGNATEVDGDHVLQQVGATYDADGNAIFLTTRQRFHDATNTGDLSIGGTAVARIGYQAFYYDAANRQTNAVDFGTNGGFAVSGRPGTVMVRPAQTGTATSTGSTTTLVDTGRGEDQDYWIGATLQFTSGTLSGQVRAISGYNATTHTITFSPATASAPASGVTYTITPNALVTTYAYDAAGRLASLTDPRNIENQTFYDLLGRTTTTIANYKNGTANNADDDQITEYTYDGADHVLTLKAVINNNGTNNVFQTTQYVYGATATNGSNVYSNDLLVSTVYPGTASGTLSGGPGSGTAYAEVFGYNAIGERTSATDRNGTVHTYGYDVLGRTTDDLVTTLGTGVDGTVRRIGYTFDTAGRPYEMTSYSATSGGSVLNQTRRLYNGYGQLTTEYQEHSGTVSTSTTPKVQYTYSEGGSGDGPDGNHSRLTKVTYPNGRILWYGYGNSTSLSNHISRLAFLADGSSVSASSHIEDYAFLGLSTVVMRSRPSGNSSLTFVKQSGESNGDAGDQYTGLDRFNRVVDQRWVGSSGSSQTTIDRFGYGYDADGNPLYKNNLNSGTTAASYSELYHANGASNGYDGLNRLTESRRGTLSDVNSDMVPDTVSTLNSLAGSGRTWGLDAVGNWDTNSTAAGAGSPVVESRSHNAQNELTQTRTTSATNTLSFDFAGNTLADGSGKHFVYDAWNRLKSAYTLSGTNPTTVQTFTYDGGGRRLTEGTGTAKHLYYSDQWQVLEERQSGSATAQYVWSPTYVDELIERDRESAAAGDGGMDSTFDGDGKVTTNFGTNDDVARAVVVQPDGKTVVAGYTGSTDLDFAVARYNTDGSLDTTFDADGKQTISFGSNTDKAYAVALQPDGKIVIAGESNGTFALARLTATGALDSTFDTDGKLTTSFNGNDHAYGVVVQADGKIVAGGYTSASSKFRFAAARYLSNGTLDTTFDADGKQSFYDAAITLGDQGLAMTVDDEGRVILAGQAAGSDLAFGRLTVAGVADTTFDSDGIAKIDMGATESVQEIVTQSDGSIVAAGQKGNDFLIARVTTAGILDTTFGSSSGYTTTDFGFTGEVAYGLTKTADGKFVAAGVSSTDFGIARYTSGGVLDTTFNGSGKVTTNFVSTDAAYAVAVGPDYRVTAAGSTDGGGSGDLQFAVARYLVTNGLDERLYAQTDANHNVTSIADVFGNVKERFVYDPYGAATVRSASFGSTSDAYSWAIRNQGGRWDGITNLTNFRRRDFAVNLGRWVQQDPLGYVNGASSYQAFDNSPIEKQDPSGLYTQGSWSDDFGLDTPWLWDSIGTKFRSPHAGDIQLAYIVDASTTQNSMPGDRYKSGSGPDVPGYIGVFMAFIDNKANQPVGVKGQRMWARFVYIEESTEGGKDAPVGKHQFKQWDWDADPTSTKTPFTDYPGTGTGGKVKIVYRTSFVTMILGVCKNEVLSQPIDRIDYAVDAVFDPNEMNNARARFAENASSKPMDDPTWKKLVEGKNYKIVNAFS